MKGHFNERREKISYNSQPGATAALFKDDRFLYNGR